MRIHPTVTVVLVGLLFLGIAASGGAASDHGQQLEACADDSPANFSAPDGGDAIGYVDGYWYDEPIVIEPNGSDGGSENASAGESEDARTLNASDGLDDAEAEAVVARTAARVETLRCLSFESAPTIEVANRSEVRAAQQARLANRSDAAQRFDDGRLAAAMLLGTETSATQARAQTTAGVTRGFYDATTDEIVLISQENETYVDETTLAHELVHALQDQQFGLGQFDATLTDAALAESGLIEGDASLVELRYERRCVDPGWGTSCLEHDAGAVGGGEFLALELFFYQPYNDGGRYVESLYEEGDGWSAVDARYDDPPTSSKQIMVPDTGSGFERANVRFATDVGENWTRVDPEGLPGYDVLGPGTIGAAMIAPTFDADTGEVYSANRIRNQIGQNEIDPLRPYNYDVDATSGWEGGRLEVYRSTGDRTAVRWQTAWESEQAAARFYQRYVELLDIRGADRYTEYAGVYRFSASSSYDGRVSIRQNGSSVIVVHAPTVAALRSLDADAASVPADSTSDDGGGPIADVAEQLTSPGTLLGIGSMVIVGLVAVGVARRR